MIKSKVYKKLNHKLKWLIKKDQLNRKIKRIYGFIFHNHYNKFWKQKINWRFKWKNKKSNWNRFFNKYDKKAKSKNKTYLKNIVTKRYLRKYNTNSIVFLKINTRQFLETFDKIKKTRRYLSDRRAKRKKLNWYRAKYKQKFINQYALFLSQMKHNKLKLSRNNNLRWILQNSYLSKKKIKKYLKNNKKNKQLAEFIKYIKKYNRRFKPYWTYIRFYKRRRYWWHKNRVLKHNIKQKFSKKYIKKIKNFLFKTLLRKYKQKIKQKNFIINQYGIKKDNRAYYKKQKNKQRLLEIKLKNKLRFKNKNKLRFRRYYQYKIFDNINKKIKINYLSSKKLFKFIAKINSKNIKPKPKQLEPFYYNKITSKKLLNLKSINYSNILKIKNNLINLSKIKIGTILPELKISFYNLNNKIKSKKLKKYAMINIYKTKRIKWKLKRLKFRTKAQFKYTNKNLYDLKKFNNNNLFNSLVLLKQKKQILYLNSLSHPTELFCDQKKTQAIKKIKVLKKIYKIKLLNYIKIKKILNNKINENKQSLNKISYIKKIKVLKKIKLLYVHKLKIKQFIKFYKNKLKIKVKWLFIDINRRLRKSRKYNNLLATSKFKNFILNKQNTNLIRNNYNSNNKLKLYSYSLGKHIDDNNKWMNYYIKKSFKWKFFRKRWHYRYSKWKKLLYFKKLMKRAKDSYRKIQKNFIFIKLFRTNFTNFVGINEEELLNKWIKLRRGNNNNDNVNIVTRFNQMLQLKLDGLVIFLGLSPSRFLAQELIRCGGLRVNGVIVTNKNHFINLNNILQIDLQIKEDLKLFYSFNHWTKVKARLKYVEFLQVMWPMMMFMLVRWPYNYELYEDSILTSRWLRFFIRYFPTKISKYKKLKVKWYKF